VGLAKIDQVFVDEQAFLVGQDMVRAFGHGKLLEVWGDGDGTGAGRRGNPVWLNRYSVKGVARRATGVEGLCRSGQRDPVTGRCAAGLPSVVITARDDEEGGGPLEAGQYYGVDCR
jgi:hypothetical protein